MPPTVLSPKQLVRRFGLPAVFVLLVAGHQGWPGCGPDAAPELAAEAPFTQIEGVAFGAGFTLKLVAPLDAEAEQALNVELAAILDGIDRRMSTYKPETELSRFNAGQGLEPTPMSPMTLAVLREAVELNRASGGAFDVTVRPLVRVWGFGAGAAAVEPTAEAIAAALALVGPDKLELDVAAGTIRKFHPAVEVDLSAIAPGWAADRVAEALEAHGWHDYLVDVGGEYRLSGSSPGGEPWRVGIEQPDSTARRGYAVASLDSGALATSGDYRAYREVEGRRISHTIDPRTGQTVSHGLASVTVLHALASQADGWATALSVLGPDEGMRVAEQNDLAVFFIVREGAGFAARTSAAWRRSQGEPAG